MPNLQHLCLSSYLYRSVDAYGFLKQTAGLGLKTLHIGEEELGSKYCLSEQWVAIAKGEDEIIKAEKVVVYGSKYWAAQDDPMAQAIENFHWVITYCADGRSQSQTRPPFLDFDGSVPLDAERFWLRQ